MKRFFLLLAMAALMLTAAAQPKYWTWAGYSPNRDWNEYFARLKDVGIGGVLLNASKEGYEKVIPLAQKAGIELHAWLWITNNGTIAAAHPEWLDYNRLGQSIDKRKAYVDYYKFLNPAIAGVQDEIVKYIESIASIKGLKGVSLDYCRYVDAILPTSLWSKYGIEQKEVHPEWDYGYHPEMIRQFVEKFGYDPRNQEDVNGDKAWHQFRMDKVNELVAKLVTVARRHHIEITASPFPTPEMSRRMVYQDWGKWELDRAFPMIYNGFYYGDREWIRNCIVESVRDAHAGTKIYFGVYVPDFGAGSAFTLNEAIETALKAGAAGVSLFQFDSLTPEQKKQLKELIKNNP